MSREEAIKAAATEYDDATRVAYATFTSEITRINKEYPQ